MLKVCFNVVYSSFRAICINLVKQMAMYSGWGKARAVK